MPDILHGYTIERLDAQSDNFIATKDSNTYEIHDFGIRYYKDRHDDFIGMMEYRKKIAGTLSKISPNNGSLVVPSDFFVENKKYYEAVQYIHAGISIDDIYYLSKDSLLCIMTGVARALNSLHRAGIAHGAICHENVHVIPYNNNGFIIKLTGFWNSGFFRDPAFTGVEITDLYSTGLLFSSYLAGYMLFDCSADELYQTFRNGYEPVFELDIFAEPAIMNIIKWLLWGFGQNRPSANRLYCSLRSLVKKSAVEMGPSLKLVK